MLDIQTLQSFFMWCTILNFALLIVTSLICSVAGGFVYWIQSLFFNISRETFDAAMWCWIALYKLLVIVFCAVPWVALMIIEEAALAG